MEYKDLFDIIMSNINISENNPCYGVSFIGPPGVGKSTVANILAEKLGIQVVVNDEIRRILERFDINPTENKDLVMKLACDRIIYMLEQNTSLIIDANMLNVWEQIEDIFNKYNSFCLIIKLECSEEELFRRLDYRETLFGIDNSNFSRGTREDYYRYLEILKNKPIKQKKIFFTINTENNLFEQVELLADSINKYIKKRTKIE